MTFIHLRLLTRSIVFIEKQQLTYNYRLSNLQADLPNLFVEASRSGIFNYQRNDYLELLDNLLIDVFMTSNYNAEISRGNTKNFK
ncbi:LytTR family transcriptional regulator DNA-binding domain-containing protein [Lactobacillus helsingborgensis]|uniref:LytTR family transcriptional regulator DNA-binding domain-containing protein n=1 Tax=Lactobacillus helsingborgensis TaxID=1218494 RepID=UPI0039779F47